MAATARLRGSTTERERTMRLERDTGAGTRAVISIAFLLTALFLTPLVLRPADIQAYYLALILTVLTALPFVSRIASGTLDIFEPIIPISLLIGLTFGIRTMYLAYNPVTLVDLQMGYLRFDDFVGSALLLTIAGYCSLLAGYYIIAGPMRIAPFSERKFGRRMWGASTLNNAMIAVLLGLAALATAADRPTGFDPVTNSTSVVAMLASLAVLTGCILALHIAAGDTRHWLRLALWCGALPLVAWQSFAFGTKTPILLFLFVAIAARHYAKRPIRLRVLIPAAVVAVLTVFPIINASRSGDDRILTPTASAPAVAEIGAQIGTIFREFTPIEYVQFAAEGLMSRSTGIDALSLLLKYDVSAELGNPTAYWYIPAYAFIPRVVWPTKPVLSQGTQFGRLLVNPTSAGVDLVSSFGIFHIGDLLVSFGVAGVLIGMCVLGCVYRLVYKFFDPLNSPDLGVKFLYIVLLWDLVNGFEGDIPSAYANMLKGLVVLVPLKAWLNARPANTAMRQSPVIHAGAARSSLAG